MASAVCEVFHYIKKVFVMRGDILLYNIEEKVYETTYDTNVGTCDLDRISIFAAWHVLPAGTEPARLLFMYPLDRG